MKKLQIAVLFGGQSPEHEVSIQSAKSIIAALSEMPEKYDVLPVYIAKNGGWILQNQETGTESQDKYSVSYLERSGSPVAINTDSSRPGFMITNYGFTGIPVDVVLPALHGKNGEDGSIQGLCQLVGLPCVGAGPLSSALCMDKPVSKQLTSNIQNLGQVPFIILDVKELEDFRAVQEKVEKQLGYPCFVKPANAGSSRGISRANNSDELLHTLNYAAEHDFRIIVERAVTGRELEVGVLGNSDPVASAVGEIVTSQGFYDYDAKYTEGAAEIKVPARIDVELSDKIRGLAINIYKTLGCSGMARVDFFLEKDTNRIVFNEVNTIPGFTPTSMYPKLFSYIGITLPQLIDKLVELALEG